MASFISLNDDPILYLLVQGCIGNAKMLFLVSRIMMATPRLFFDNFEISSASLS